MAAWLTYDEAIAQLERGPEEDRPRIEALIPEATQVVANFLAEQADAGWDPATVPLHVKAATKLTLANLYYHRGDDPRLDAQHWEAVERLLVRTRTPAFG